MKSLMTRCFQKRYQLLWLLAVAIFLVHYGLAGQAVYGDGIGYYSYLHSWVIDTDLDLTNEFHHHYSPKNNNAVNPISEQELIIVNETSKGVADNPWGPGTAVLLVGDFWLVHVLVRLLNSSGSTFSTSGYGNWYQIAAGLSVVSWGILSMWLLEKNLEQLKPRLNRQSLIVRSAPIVLFLSTPLLYYLAYDVINSHFASFVVVNGFFYVALHWKPDLYQSALLGLLAGFAPLVRPQDGALALIGVFFLWTTHPKQRWRYLVVFLSGFVITASQFMWHWSQMYHSPLEFFYVRNFLEQFGGEANVFWSDRLTLGSLFDFERGLIGRTPLLGLLLGFAAWKNRAQLSNFFRTVILDPQQLFQSSPPETTTFGLFATAQHHSPHHRANIRKRIPKLLWLYFGIQLVAIIGYAGWTGRSFGGRMFISTFLLFGLLLTDWLEWLQLRFSKQTAAVFAAGVIAFNMLSMGSFILYEKHTQDGGRGTEEKTIERVFGRH